MQKFLATYATAAHLALLAVAPLFLFPYVGDDVMASVVLWLSLLSAAWIVMSPACRSGEMPHAARERFCREVVKDPVTWFLIVVVAFAGIRALNGGIALGYDAESMTWSVTSPYVEMLPGCATGTGFFPFAASVALFVVLLGARHALGYRESIAFLNATAALAGVSAVVSAIALTYGNDVLAEAVLCSYQSPSFVGTAYGLYFICGVVAFFGCIEAGWRRAEPLAIVSVVCCAVGLEFFSPPATIAVFAVVFVLMSLVAFPLMKGRFVNSASLRCALVLLIVAVSMGFFLMFGDSFAALGDKKAAMLALNPFPDGFFASRDAMSSICLASWKQSPWLGSGLGSFPLDLRFAATQADWAVISPRQAASVNGWWQLLLERGIVGTLVVALGLVFLVYTYLHCMVKSFGGPRWHLISMLGPFAVLALVALAFVDISFLRPDVLVPAAAFMALSAVGFQPDSHSSDT